MNRKPLLAAFAAAAISSGAFAAGTGTDAAGAQRAANPPVPSNAAGFGQLDTDQDGTLSREEAQGDPRLGAQIDRLDANGDGMIDESEFSALEGRLPSEAAPGGRPEGSGPPSVDVTPERGTAPGGAAPGMGTEPGASEAAPGRSM